MTFPTYTDAAIWWQFPGGTRGSLISTKVVLLGGRTRGSFAGQFIIGGDSASGTFSCR